MECQKLPTELPVEPPKPSYKNLSIMSASATDERPATGVAVTSRNHESNLTLPCPTPTLFDIHHFATETFPIATWPMAQLPVEIFEIITSHLTRAEVKALRLVCREFEAKVSGQYFRNVVVPFRSELYNSLGCNENGAIKPPATNLFTNGMRIFESFGPHILRFALSLELDEDTLAYPPVKPVQEAVPAFWGVYRWPHETYHRYTDLEGLEQTADETQGMKGALRCLSKVANLGLCCDAGLGFLAGPDQAARKATVRHPVFDTNDWRQDQRTKKSNPVITVADFNEVSKDTKRESLSQLDSFKRKVLEKMVSDAGFPGSQIDEAIDLMLESEGTTLASIDFDERYVAVNEREHRSHSQISGPADVESQTNAEPEPAPETTRHPLIPTNLTRAQKELLLELEWAHRAMIQSYVIGLIDNAADGCFKNLTTLTIAKIPSAHVHILCREELWRSLPSVKNVSLGVIADWRKISKSSPGCVEDTPVSPVEAVGKVFKLLNDYIGKQPNVESIRFEWICGGEFAPSSYQRNQYILPAPFVESPESMAMPDSARRTEKLLHLPHIKHLSLKNCWVSPHVMLQTIRQMALQSLEKLEFESVSLSGPPITIPQPSLYIHALGQGVGAIPGNINLMNLFPVMGAQAASFLPVTLGIPIDPKKLSIPETMSWAGIIEHFSPGVKIRNLMLAQNDPLTLSTSYGGEKFENATPFLPDAGSFRVDEKKYNLKCLSFKSCGYVYLDVSYLNTRAIMPQDGQQGYAYSNSHRHDIFGSMQFCKDRLFGRILPYVAPREMTYLDQVFRMDHGWDKVYDEQTFEDAVADGVECPGLGRFSGVIKSDRLKPW